MEAVTLAGRGSSAGSGRFALFAYGFRPFFLLAGIYALVSVPFWLWTYARGAAPLANVAPQFWHGHEMIYGFVAAAIAGFLLTAVPSWTGTRGFAGWPLVGLILLWLAGRAAFAAGDLVPVWMIATIELAFLPALAALLAPPLLRSRNRNTAMLMVLAVLWLVDAAFLHGMLAGDAVLAQRALHGAINMVLLLVTVIGARIVPAFTSNALRQRGQSVDLSARPVLDRALVAVMITNLVLDAVNANVLARGAIAATAAIVHAWRLAGWQGLRTLREPIVWALHVGYAWLPIGFVLKALSLLFGVSGSAQWIHAFTLGAFGTMILAVMTRASLGHTGRPLVVSGATASAYLLLTAAAIVRVWGGASGALSHLQAVTLAGVLSCTAFALFVFVYAPILIGPRADGKPG